MVKKILLQTGIFVTVFAVGAGAGFMSCYVSPTNEQRQTVPQVEATPETPSEKFLNNLVSSKALEGDIHAEVNSEKTGEITLDLNNIQVSIANLTKIKVAADIEVKYSTLDVKASFGYFDNVIYVDYDETHLQLATDDISQVMDMLPTFGLNLDTSDLLGSLDFDALLSSLGNMEETNNGEEHYFMFKFNDDISIRFDTNDNYELLGVTLPETELMGMKISAQADLHTLSEDISTLICPALKEGAPVYQDFSPTFTLVKGVMNLVNDKQGTIDLSIDVDKNDASFIDVAGDFTFNLNDMAVLADLNISENEREHNIKVGYENNTLYANYNTLKVSIEKKSIADIVTFVMNKIGSGESGTAINDLSSIISDINIDQILGYVNDLPEFLSNLVITSNSLSLTIDPSYFDVPVSAITLGVGFNDEGLTGIEISNIGYGEYVANVKAEIKDYKTIAIDAENYVAIDPAVSLLDGVEKLINQKQFRLQASARLVNIPGELNDVTFDADVEFDIENKFGFGSLTVVDSDGYNHNIKADLKSVEEILLSYNDTVNCYFSIQSLKDIYTIVTDLINNKDEHFMELFGSMLDSMKDTPINAILAGDYTALLSTNIINSLNVTETEIVVSLNGAILGYPDKNVTLTVRYEDGQIKGLDIADLVINDTEVSASINLVEYDASLEETNRLTKDDSYIDLSDIKVLLEFGLNTTKFNYYHATGNFNLSLLTVSLDVEVDVKIRNIKGEVTILLTFPDIPTVGYGSLSANANTAYGTTSAREAYIMYQDGSFYVYRKDTVNVKGINVFWKGYYELFLRCDMDYFMDNILTIICQDVLGLTDTIMNQITKSDSSEKGQIEYEKIIRDFKHDKDAGTFFISLDLGELAQNDDFETFEITIRSNDNNCLEGLDVKLVISVGIDITLTGSLTLCDDTTVTIDDSNKITYLEDYVAAHINDTLNEKTTKETTR